MSIDHLGGRARSRPQEPLLEAGHPSDPAAALGAEGRMFEWPGLTDYVCVDEWDCDWICDNFDVGPSVHDDQMAMC
jgi:hypothetical protein